VVKHSVFDKFFLNNEISDEAVYAIYEFLEYLFLAFEESEFGRIRRHLKELKAGQVNKDVAADDPPF
jgi:hypothetical protein